MASELPINPPGNQLDWYSKVLGIGASGGVPFPLIDRVLSTILPTIDAFGTEKIAQVGYAQVQGALGGVEVAHNAPLLIGANAPRARIYLSMEYWHDDVVNRQIRAGRIIPDSSGTFPFVAISNSLSIAGDTGAGGGDNRLAVRNVTIGPNQRIAARADQMGGGARLTLRVAFIEFQVGQYVRSIS